MSSVARVLGWIWLLAGMLAVASLAFQRFDIPLAVPDGAADLLALPWSRLIPMVQPGHGLSLVLTMIGVFVNAQILFITANMLDD